MVAMFWIGRFALSCLASAVPVVQGAAPGHSLDYTELARTFLSENALEELARSGPGGHSFQELLDGPAFVRLDLVGLDVRFPRRALASAETADQFREVVAALVEVQRHWTDWQHPELSAGSADDWKALAKWVKSWPRGKLGAADGGRSLLESLGASEDVLGSATPVRRRSDEGGQRQRVGSRPPALRRTARPAARRGAAGLVRRADGPVERPRGDDDPVDRLDALVALQYAQLPRSTRRPFNGSRDGGRQDRPEQYARARCRLCLRQSLPAIGALL
jgi:hypothetical protein